MFFVNFTSTNNSVTTAQLNITMGVVKADEIFGKYKHTVITNIINLCFLQHLMLLCLVTLRKEC